MLSMSLHSTPLHRHKGFDILEHGKKLTLKLNQSGDQKINLTQWRVREFQVNSRFSDKKSQVQDIHDNPGGGATLKYMMYP